MEITQSVFRTMLSNIFNISQDYIIPKQGNWFNPQMAADLEVKPLTWIGYRVGGEKPISTTGHAVDTDDNGDPIDVLVTQTIVDIELNFIGTRAETCAKSVMTWHYRQDVEEELETIFAKLMNTDCIVQPYDYPLDGLNTIIEYRVNIKLARKSVVPTGSLLIDDTYSFTFGGNIDE